MVEVARTEVPELSVLVLARLSEELEVVLEPLVLVLALPLTRPLPLADVAAAMLHIPLAVRMHLEVQAV